MCFLTSQTHVTVHQFGNRLEITSNYDKSKGTGKRGIDVIVGEGGGGGGGGGLGDIKRGDLGVYH